MNNQTKKLMVIAAILGILCIVVGIIDLLPAGNSNQPGVYDETVGEEDVFNVVVPWEEEGAKQPEDYTKEEYEQLSPAQKDKFQNSFETEDEYHNWAEKENVVVEQYPWHTGGKKPEDYTLKEYEALSDQQKVGFKLYFGALENFEAWYKSAQEYEKLAPWETGGKQPSEYTLEEYLSLSDSLQMKFQSTFEDTESFDAWYNQVTLDYANTMSWENGGKKPSEYTLAEYKALNNLEQLMFQSWFASFDEFEAWFAKAEAATVEKNPWETGGKKPSEYTLAEFNALTASQQIAFQKWFDNTDAFDEWMDKQINVPEEEKNPWENGGKKPSEYTLAEFNALTASQQIAFQKWFASELEFDSWMQKQQVDSEPVNNNPWETSDKKPSDYTLAEFNALTGSQQIAFQKWFETDAAFDAWLAKAEENSFVAEEVPWDKGGKTPDQYTLSEFNELSGPQQIAFQKWFGSEAAFDAWLAKAEGDSFVAEEVPWDNGGKTPDQYTLSEFNELSGSQQIAFQKWFGSDVAFDAWLSNVQQSAVDGAEAPWDNGGKAPNEYTWEEFEELSGPLQIRFQYWFTDPDGFENWMNSVIGNE